MWELNWGFTEWSTITTIGLSVVAIIIAICSSHSTSKDANRQIREIKQLSSLQIDTTIKMVETEIQKTIAKVKLSAMEAEEIDEINNSGMAHMVQWREEMMREHEEKKAQRDLQIYRECSQNLNEILKSLKDLKNKLG